MPTPVLMGKSQGALLPWVYTLLTIIGHIPVVVIRVVRWDLAQTLCIVSALFSVALFVQSYVSTAFDPSQILVWSPLILVIDAGAMAQIFFLVIEAKKARKKSSASRPKTSPERPAPRQCRGNDIELACSQHISKRSEASTLPRAKSTNLDHISEQG